MNTLNNFKPNNLNHDWVSWSGSGDGIFTVKSLKSILLGHIPSKNFWDSFVWVGLAPPKTELFVWLVTKGMVPVKSELLKRGCTGLSNDLCTLCNETSETVNHLFFSCKVSWTLWTHFLSFSRQSLSFQHNPIDFLEEWGAITPSQYRRLWLLIPFAILWSIWLARNEITFRGLKLDQLQLLQQTKHRIACWITAKFKECSIPLEALTVDPFLAKDTSLKLPKAPAPKIWTPPPMGFLKLNIDGAVSLESLKGGIGGIIRDPAGLTLMQFSTACGVVPVTLAELLVVKEGIYKTINLTSDLSVRIIVESDCKSVVDWLTKSSNPPVAFAPMVMELTKIIESKGVILRLIPRECNTRADALAKSGIG
ncbi:hypothetical protein like AT4G29090 [Hibiscus trionum]|uniref:RNase H type-1 domain-containing protein n=1 Tax=Hibiscus trionum TaxID=183268 RepID=A0A9W7MCZ8_HIBTR|nr:hypothetical protein like AT4G29090 [Hibiscus trionum]